MYLSSLQSGSLLSASLDAKLKVFDIERGTCKRTCLGHRKGVLSVAAVDSLALLVSGGLDRDLLVWPYVGAGGGRALASGTSAVAREPGEQLDRPVVKGRRGVRHARVQVRVALAEPPARPRM